MTDGNPYGASGAVYCQPRPAAAGRWVTTCACPRQWQDDSRAGLHQQLVGHRCELPDALGNVDAARVRAVLDYVATRLD